MEKKRLKSPALITGSLILFLIVGLSILAFCYIRVIYNPVHWYGESDPFDESLEEIMWLSYGLIILFIPFAWLVMLIGLIALIEDIKKKFMPIHAIIALIIWAFILVPIVYTYEDILTWNSFYSLIIMMFMIHFTIGLPLYKIGGRWYFYVNTGICFIGLYLIYLAQGIETYAIGWAMTVSLPFIFHIIIYRKLLKRLDERNKPTEVLPILDQL